MSSPQFTSTPSSAAAEGTQYVYAITVTDTAPGTLSLSLTTAPTGATVSGSTLTWTPTAAQSRTANSFTITLTNTATSKTASQTWSVTPTGIIRGTRIVTYVTENGEVNQPDNLNAVTIAAHVPNGSGFTTLQGSGAADGTFTIAGVPAGTYWLQHDVNFILTSTSNVDLGSATLGRPDLTYPTSATGVIFNLDGLSPWQADDVLGWYIANTNTEVVMNINISTGQTSFSLAQPWNLPLVDSSKGDRLYAGQLVSSTVNGKTIQVLEKLLGPLAVTVADGSTATVTGTMSDVTLGSVIRANFKSSVFSGYRTSTNPQATNDGTFVLLGALPGGTSKGLTGLAAYLVTYLNSNGPFLNDTDLGDISYGNPFPVTWSPILLYFQQFAIPYTAPGASTPIIFKPLIHVATANLPDISNPLQPLVAPVTTPRINGTRDLFQTQSSVGQTPTLSWQAPVPAPTGYGITVFRLFGNPVSTASVVAYLWTDTTSITLPPGLMSPGNTYFFRIRSFNSPGLNFPASPYRQAFPWAYADAFTGTVNP